MNSFGKQFRLEIFGESHGEVCGILIDGIPPGINLKCEDFFKDLDRRKSGSFGTTPRIESDKPHISSGLFKGKTTGAPLLIQFINENIRSKDYDNMLWRPGHADFTAEKKYKGYSDFRGGGHFSGRITLGLVAAGVVAKKILEGVNISAEIDEVGGQKDYTEAIKTAVKEGDSLGGIIRCNIEHLPIGLGEPFFDSVESLISHIIFSIPGIRGIEFGQGFDASKISGYEHNDRIKNENGELFSNNAGGLNGGISNGNPVYFRVAVKPTASIYKIQKTYSKEKHKVIDYPGKGRHDAAFVLRVPVIVEAAAAIVLADLLMLNKIYN